MNDVYVAVLKVTSFGIEKVINEKVTFDSIIKNYGFEF